MKVIDKINCSGLFAQSAFSASTATKDSLGRDITATYLTGVNIPESATWNETSNVVSSNSAQWNQGKTYEGVSPVVVNNAEDKISAETWVLSAGNGISFTENSANKVTRIDVTAQGGNYIPYTAVNTGTFPYFETNSGLRIKKLENGILNSTYIDTSTIQIRYLYSPTGISPIKWGAVLSNSELTFDTESDSAYVDIGKIHNWDSASNYIQTISSTYYPKSNPSSFATESWVTAQGYLTAHQDISNKLDSSAFSSVSGDFLTTSFSIPESAVWNETSNVVQTNSAQWAEGGGAISSYTSAWSDDVQPYGDFVINTLNEKYISSLISNSANSAKFAYNSNSANSANYAETVNETYLENKGFARNLSSEYGTVSIIHNNIIESTNSAISRVGNEGFVSSYGGEPSVGDSKPATYTWDKSLPNTTITLDMGWSNGETLTYSANTDLTGEIVLPTGTSTQTIDIPNATEIKVWTSYWLSIENAVVSAADSFETVVGELAWTSALPTYKYDSTNKISAINGSAIAQSTLSSLNTANVNNIIVTASLPSTTDANTLYLIPEA